MACSECKITTLEYFTKTYRDNDKVLDILLRHNLVAKAIRCELCSTPIEIKWKDNDIVYECTRRFNKERCSFTRSGRKDTFMENSQLPIQDIIAFFLFWCQLPYPRQHLIQSELGWTARTVVNWSSFCREVCKSWVFENCQKIGGPNKVVEVSEAKFGKVKYLRKGEWVCGGIQRDDKSKFFLIPVNSKCKETLIALIEGWINPGTTVVSNCRKFSSYFTEEDISYLKKHHSIEFLSTRDNGAGGKTHPGDLVHTRNINRQWRNVMYSIPTFRKKRKTTVAGYLAEHLFKAHYGRTKVTHSFLAAIGTLYPADGLEEEVGSIKHEEMVTEDVICRNNVGRDTEGFGESRSEERYSSFEYCEVPNVDVKIENFEEEEGIQSESENVPVTNSGMEYGNDKRTKRNKGQPPKRGRVASKSRSSKGSR